MNKAQKEHLQHIIDSVTHDIAEKYKQGAKEHKTTLNKDHSSLALAYFILEEALDQLTYAYTLIEYLERGK